MLPLLNSEQIRLADKFTIQHEPIASIDLMERAAAKCAEWIQEHFSKEQDFAIICGQGNNGGDGLAIARMLFNSGYSVSVIVLQSNQHGSEDFEINLKRCQNILNIEFLSENNVDMTVSEHAIIIDAIFGTGLNKPISNWIGKIIQQINKLSNTIISIDLPSGLFADASSLQNTNIVQSNFTLSFEFPKLSFMFAENQQWAQNFTILPIGLSKEFVQQTPTTSFLLTSQDISGILRKRNAFSHKGHYGHSCIIAGSKGKMGAAVLSAKSCLRSGTGLLTVHVPECGVNILQTSVPEAMLSIDENVSTVSSVKQIEKYNAIGVGPGIGTSKFATAMLKILIQNSHIPLVFDADALNIISENKTWLGFLPAQSILTPHPKEFERLFGTSKNQFERLEHQRTYSQKHQLYIVLKDAHTCITTPEGKAYFNSTGNPGMATGGSGDVLTGIITGLLAQHYTPFEASLCGVYLHGLAGDFAASDLGEYSLKAGDITEYLPKAFMQVMKG